MGWALQIPGESKIVELPAEPLQLARALFEELSAPLEVLPLRIGVETEVGFEYAPGDVARMVEALEATLQQLDRILDSEGRPFAGDRPRSYFNERQALRAALALFRAARERGREVRAGV